MKSYKQLSIEERKELFLMNKQSFTKMEIAKILGRARSTIDRELERNTVDERLGYLPDEAHSPDPVLKPAQNYMQNLRQNVDQCVIARG